MDNTPTQESKAQLALEGSRKNYWILLVYLVAISALGSFVNDMYSPALPEMRRYFGCTISVAQLGLTMGMIGLAIGQVILGPISDRYGRKIVLVSSVSLFIAAAVVSIFSPTIHFFLGCRLVQGLGASGAYFLARTIPADLYTGRALAKFMAVIGAINGVAPASAPVIGGVVAEVFTWKGIFVLLTIYAAILLLCSPLLKESLPPSRRDHGSWSASFMGYITLLKNKPFMIHVIFKGLALGLLFAYISGTPFIIQDHYGYSESAYGILIGVNAIFVAAGSLVATKFRPLKKASVVGAIILLVAMGAETVCMYLVHSIIVFEALIVICMFGLGMIFTVTNTLAMNEGRDRAGEASAVLGVAGYIVGAVASPLAGLGDVIHSTANVFAVLTVLVAVFAFASYRLPADLDK